MLSNSSIDEVPRFGMDAGQAVLPGMDVPIDPVAAHRAVANRLSEAFARQRELTAETTELIERRVALSSVIGAKTARLTS